MQDFTGKTWRDFSKQNEVGLSDFTDHLSGIFTEARLKNYLEIRCADGGNLAHVLAICAFWKGLLYDAETLEEVFKIAPQLSAEEFRRLQNCVAKSGLQAEHGKVLKTAKTLIETAEKGLRRIAPGEIKYLRILRENVIEKEISQSDIWLEKGELAPEKLIDGMKFC